MSPTDAQKQRLADVHGVESYSDLPQVVRNVVEADDTRLTDRTYEPRQPAGAMADHIEEASR